MANHLLAVLLGCALAALIPHCAAVHPLASATQCNGTSTYCAAGWQCCPAMYSPTKQGCQQTMCCTPGPENPPSTTLPNCLVIGDSVSIGYTPYAVTALKDVCQLQHGPWDVSDGGAGSTSYGQACLDNWLVTQAQQPVKWDVILFNFGLHNLDNSSQAEAQYAQQFLNITQRLVATKAKLIYALTTPYMPDYLVGNYVVEQLNAIAQNLTKPYNIPIVNLYKVVTDHCGAKYVNCDWCNASPCSYHYQPPGYEALAAAVTAAFKQVLSGGDDTSAVQVE